MSETLAKTESSGAAKPPEATPPVAAAATDPAQPIICPETGRPCEERPACNLAPKDAMVGATGKVYCAAWVAKRKAEGLATLSRGQQ